MTKPKRERRSKFGPTDKKPEPLEIEVSFTLSKPPPPPFIGTPPVPQPAKKTDGPEHPPIIFRF